MKTIPLQAAPSLEEVPTNRPKRPKAAGRMKHWDLRLVRAYRLFGPMSLVFTGMVNKTKI